MEASSRSFEDALLSLDRIQCREILTSAMCDEGRLKAFERIVVPAMARIGDRWEGGDLALAQVYMSGRLCEETIDTLIQNEATTDQDGPVIGLAVFLDHHQLGKRIVGSALRSGGYRVIDYGAGLGTDELAQRALGDGVAILMVSVLMLNSALQLKDLKRALGDGPGRPFLVVGGAPFRFNTHLGTEVGADAVGTTGTDAVYIAQRLLRHS
jgi:methanogenic corrinoid protein MtbC1